MNPGATTLPVASILRATWVGGGASGSRTRIRPSVHGDGAGSARGAGAVHHDAACDQELGVVSHVAALRGVARAWVWPGPLQAVLIAVRLADQGASGWFGARPAEGLARLLVPGADQGAVGSTGQASGTGLVRPLVRLADHGAQEQAHKAP